MSGANHQIVALAKQGLNAAEIAEALGYEVEAVEFVLANDAEVQKALDLAQSNFLEKEFEALESLALRTLKELMANADKDTVRMAATAYTLDQRLGLKKPKHNILVLNVGDINKRLIEVRERKKQLEQQCIDVESKLTAVA